MVDEERYFVMFAADDVKELTLDQLDDAYRLDVIDDDTLLWQEGFDGWKPLSEVVGAADESEAIDDVSAWADVAGSGFAASAPAYSAPAGALGATQQTSYGQQSAYAQQSYAHQAPAPNYPQQSSYPAQGAYAQPSSYPHSIPPASAPLSLAPASTQAVVYDTVDEPELVSPWFRRALFVAAAAGALIVSQRTGFAHSFARALDQGRSAERIEASVLGSPAVDTPRGLEAKLSEIESRYNLDHLSYTDPVRERQPAAADAKAPAQGTNAQGTNAEGTTSAQAAPPPGAATPAAAGTTAQAAGQPAAPAAAPEAKPAAENPFASRMGNVLSGKPAEPVRPAAATARPAAKRPAKLKVGTHGGDPNDPMNGAL
jgi:hypothetical protein